MKHETKDEGQFKLRMPVDLLQRLKAEAIDQGRTLNSHIAMILKEKLKESQQPTSEGNAA